MLHSICQKVWKTQQWPQDWKRSVFIPIPKKGNAKECSNYRTNAYNNQSILKISPVCSLEGLMLKLKLQYSGHLIWRADSSEKTLMLGKTEGRRRRGRQRMRWLGWHHRLNGHEFEQALGVGNGQGGLACFSPCGRRESDTTEQLNWTELNWTKEWHQNLIQFLLALITQCLGPYVLLGEYLLNFKWINKKISFKWNEWKMSLGQLFLFTLSFWIVVMSKYEGWTIKKPEHQRTDAFKLWFWKRLLRVPQQGSYTTGGKGQDTTFERME